MIKLILIFWFLYRWRGFKLIHLVRPHCLKHICFLTFNMPQFVKLEFKVMYFVGIQSRRVEILNILYKWVKCVKRINVAVDAFYHLLVLGIMDLCPNNLYWACEFLDVQIQVLGKTLLCQGKFSCLKTTRKTILTLWTFVCLFTFICLSSYFFGCSSSSTCTSVGEKGL